MYASCSHTRGVSDGNGGGRGGSTSMRFEMVSSGVAMGMAPPLP
jgi:hypothetical protein